MKTLSLLSGWSCWPLISSSPEALLTSDLHLYLHPEAVPFGHSIAPQNSEECCRNTEHNNQFGPSQSHVSVIFYDSTIPFKRCHAAAAAAKSHQSCPTLCNPIGGSPPGSPVPGILQARTLEWVAISFSTAWKWKLKVKLLSRVRLLATPWTAAHQAPLSLRFSRQEYWSGVPLPSPPKLLVCYNYWKRPVSSKIVKFILEKETE